MKSERQMEFLSCFLILGASSFAALPLPCLAASPLDEACTYYGQHDYAKSLKLLDQLPAKAQTAKSDYYRALNLQALHRYSEASAEFHKVALQKKDPKLAAMARQGMIGLSHFSASPASLYSSAGISSSAPGAARPNNGNGKFDRAGNYTDDKWQVVKARGPMNESEGDSRPLITAIQTRKPCGRH